MRSKSLNDRYKVRTIVCKLCGETLTKRMPEGRQYCSVKCSNSVPRARVAPPKDETGLYKVRTITCKNCRNVVTKRMPEGRRFCSRECFLTALHPERKTGTEKKCAVCGVMFYAPKNRMSATTCSVVCANKWQGRGKIDCACKVCGLALRRSASMVSDTVYCSIGCRNADPEAQARLISMNQKQQKGGQTLPERIGYALLDEIGVPYLPQHLLANKFCVDAFVPSRRIIIQFDGDYWHGNSERFAVLDTRQKRRVTLDASQDAYMAACGYRVIRLWESDLKANPAHVRSRLIAALVSTAA